MDVSSILVRKLLDSPGQRRSPTLLCELMKESTSLESSPPASSTEELSLETDSDPAEPAHKILIANQQATLTVDEARLRAAVANVLADSQFKAATVSLAVVDDPTIHELNRRYLEHDYPTDVLSFTLEETNSHLTGELIVSADTASENARDAGWSASDELLLYVIHGTLHLVGYSDKISQETTIMRRAEAAALEKLGVALSPQDTRWQIPEQTDGEENSQ